EAEAWIAEYERRVRVQENKDWLARQKTAAAPTLATGNIQEVKEALAALDQLPHSTDIDDDFLNSRALLRNSLSERLTDLIVQKDWEQFYAGYQEAMEQRRLDQAARMLHQRKPADQNLQQIRQQFANSLPGELEQTIDDLIEKHYWEDAQTLLANLARDHVQWPAEMRLEGTAQLFPNQQQRVAEAHDRALYEQFRKFRSEDTAKAYLEHQPPGPMQSDVKRYLDYLKAKEQRHKFTVVLDAIEWPEEYPSDDDNVIRFEVDGHLASEVKDVESKPNAKTGEVGRFQFKEEWFLSSRVKLNVKIVNIESFIFDWAWKDANGGEGTEEVTFSELHGYRQKLDAGKWGRCIAHYRLLGGEAGRIAPKLPAWRPQ
ncbi:MAG: hypothetical protein KDA84_18755, partial [Planctomycetaceae bacterium]|nr:hypothetical protein [Planctomycetaceae bacterium]